MQISGASSSIYLPQQQPASRKDNQSESGSQDQKSNRLQTNTPTASIESSQISDAQQSSTLPPVEPLEKQSEARFERAQDPRQRELEAYQQVENVSPNNPRSQLAGVDLYI